MKVKIGRSFSVRVCSKNKRKSEEKEIQQIKQD